MSLVVSDSPDFWPGICRVQCFHSSPPLSCNPGGWRWRVKKQKTNLHVPMSHLKKPYPYPLIKLLLSSLRGYRNRRGGISIRKAWLKTKFSRKALTFRSGSIKTSVLVSMYRILKNTENINDKKDSIAIAGHELGSQKWVPRKKNHLRLVP